MPAVKSLRREIACRPAPLGAGDFCVDSPGVVFNLTRTYPCHGSSAPRLVLEPSIRSEVVIGHSTLTWDLLLYLTTVKEKGKYRYTQKLCSQISFRCEPARSPRRYPGWVSATRRHSSLSVVIHGATAAAGWKPPTQRTWVAEGKGDCYVLLGGMIDNSPPRRLCSWQSADTSQMN